MREFDVTLLPNEELLVGSWVRRGDGVAGDETCKRIDRLVTETLEHIADDPTGWDSLYRDPADGRLWERYYTQSDSHGGGPASLRHVSVSEAKAKYALTGVA